MLISVLALAMILGGATAVAAFAAGWSFFAVLAIYSGVSLLGALGITLSVVIITTLQSRDPDLDQSGMVVGK